MTGPYLPIARLKDPAALGRYLAELGIDLPFDDSVLSGPDSPLAQPRLLRDGRVIGNRFCIQPMEGWDGTPDGRPTELTFKRWLRFGRSGAKLIWGGEATAVRPDGRANPNQLMILAETRYKDLPADILSGRPLQRKRICRTFSDCTTALRNGMVSGCYPLDPEYKTRPEAERMKTIKKQHHHP